MGMPLRSPSGYALAYSALRVITPILKVHYYKFENLPMALSSYENIMSKISH